VFKPLIEELQDLGEPLDREEFVDATNRLYQVLNQNDKNLILRFGKKQKETYIAEQCVQRSALSNQPSILGMILKDLDLPQHLRQKGAKVSCKDQLHQRG